MNNPKAEDKINVDYTLNIKYSFGKQLIGKNGGIYEKEFPKSRVYTRRYCYIYF